MINKILLSTYKRVPYKIREALSVVPNQIPLEVLYGEAYRNWIDFLKDSQNWSEQRIYDYQIRKIQETCKNAYENTTYYHKLFNECGFNVESFRYLDQIEIVPFLTKQIIQENAKDMVNKNFPKQRMNYVTTGGSTGIPMGFYVPDSDKMKENAFVNYMWGSVGYRHTDRVAVLRGGYLGEKGTAYRKGNRLLLSSYHMTDEDLSIQYETLKKFQPKYFHVYPSAMYILCDFIKKNNLETIESLQAILTASENLYPYQREFIGKVMKRGVFDFYGHSEHACMAGGCEKHPHYHIYWQYGYTELVGGSGKKAVSENEPAEIVATTYDNFAMPLIRYKTMDIASHSLDTCECGRNYKIIKSIKGRMQELLITSTGRYISMTAINMHNSLFDHVYQFQFYQDNTENCILNIVKKAEYDACDEKRIYTEIGRKLGDDVEFRINYVDEIPKTSSGKHRFLIQKLPIAFSEGIFED